MMLKKTTLTLALSLGLVVGASAMTFTNTHDVGTLNAGATFSDVITVSAGSFLDQWKFNVAQSLESTGAIGNLSLQLSSPSTLFKFNISGLDVNLYTGSGTLIQQLTGTADYKLGSGIFPTGNYYFTVGGTADGTLGGRYLIGANVLAVPEPESYAMLLAGLGLMGTIARRRSKSKPV